MKRVLATGILLWWMGILVAACGDARPPLKVRIGTDATYPPFEMVAAGRRELIGFDIELMKAIASRANLELELVNTSFNGLLAGIAQCQYDGGIAAIPITDERKTQMAFSDPYITVGQVVVVHRGNVTITRPDQLVGMLVGAQTGSPGAREVQKIAGAQLQTYRSFDSAFQDLTQGVIDAVVVDRPLAATYVNTRANRVKIAGPEFANEEYGIAICNQKPDLVQRINAAIQSVRSDGTLAKLTDKWIVNGGQ